MTPDTLPSDTPPSPQTSWSSLIVKGLLWFSLGLLVLLICAGLLLTYWFPANMVRQELEVRLSKMLQGTVRIHSLSFNLLTGLQVSRMEFIKPDQPPLTLQYLTLDYSLLHLLKGTFTINEISIDQANVSLNVPELTKGAPEPTPPPPSEPPAFPHLPVSVDLDTLQIRDSTIQMILAPEFIVHLSHLNLQSSGGMSSDEAHLKGAVQVGQLSLAFQGNHLQLPLDITYDASLHVPSEHLDLNQLTIRSEPAFRLTVSGELKEFLSQQVFHLTLADTQVDLRQVLTLAKDFVPPEFAPASIQGSLSPAINLTGSLPDSGFHGTIHAELNGKNFQLHLPDQALAVGPTNFTLTANEVQIKENFPLRGAMAATLSSRNLTFQTYGIQQLKVMLESDYQDSGPFSGIMNFSGTTRLPGELLGTSVDLPFAIALVTSGNHRSHQVHIEKLNVDLSPYGSVKVKGGLTPYPSPKQGLAASLEARLSPNVQAILARIPEERLQGLMLRKGIEPDSLIVKATGGLHPDFRPEWGKATAALKLFSLRAGMDSMGIGGHLRQLTVLLASGYKATSGEFEGTLGVSSHLSDLRATEGINIGSGAVVLKSSFQGQVSPAYQLTGLRSQDQFQLTLDNTSYRHPSLTATLPSLRLTSRTKEDVFNHLYLLERLRVTSDNLLEVDVKGRFLQPTHQFDVDVQMPLFHVGNLLTHLSGPLMEGVGEMNPKGLISLALQSAGTVPQAADLETFQLPLGLQGRVTLRDLEGAVAGYRVQGGNGTMTMAYSPQATPQTQLSTQMTLDHLGLPETLPVRQLSEAALRINITSPDLQEIQIHPVKISAKGADLSLTGSVAGLRELLMSTSPPGTTLAKLFARLHTRVNLDLTAFQKTLQHFEAQGTGKAMMDLSILKQEQGNVNMSVQLGTEQLALARHDLQLDGMNGGIHLKKSLAYTPDGLPAPLKKSFQPSDRVAELKSYSRKGQTLTIDHFQLGTLAITNLSTNLTFEQQALKLQNLVMNLLGGGIGGHIIIDVERPLRVSAELQVADLDANQLIETQSKISGDSQIAATLGLSTIFQETTGAVDLSQLECTLHITHIGKEALDRLLVFLDPEGSNPTISNARAQLNLANPSKVTLEVARGQLNLAIHFQGSFLPTFKLNRVPIAKMKNVEKLTAAIPNWEDLAKVLDLVGAETYSLTPEGSVVVQ